MTTSVPHPWTLHGRLHPVVRYPHARCLVCGADALEATCVLCGYGEKGNRFKDPTLREPSLQISRLGALPEAQATHSYAELVPSGKNKGTEETSDTGIDRMLERFDDRARAAHRRGNDDVD